MAVLPPPGSAFTFGDVLTADYVGTLTTWVWDLLYPGTTYVHASHFTEEEWELVRDSGGNVSFAPQIEIQMGHGWAPAVTALEYARVVALGGSPPEPLGEAAGATRGRGGSSPFWSPAPRWTTGRWATCSSPGGRSVR